MIIEEAEEKSNILSHAEHRAAIESTDPINDTDRLAHWHMVMRTFHIGRQAQANRSLARLLLFSYWHVFAD